MTGRVPARTTAIWLVLIVATGVTWWLGTGHVGHGAAWELTVLIIVAFAKVYLVGDEFMELRKAPLLLRTAFGAWTIAVAGGAIALSVF
jgi:hypothetical protein